MTYQEINEQFEQIKQIAIKKDSATVIYNNNTTKQFAIDNFEQKAIFGKLQADFCEYKKEQANKNTIFAYDLQARAQEMQEKFENDILDSLAKLATYKAQIEKLQEKIATAQKYCAMTEQEKIDYIASMQEKNEKQAYLQAKLENASRPFARDIFAKIANQFYLKMRDVQNIYKNGLTTVLKNETEQKIFDMCDTQIVAYMNK